MGVATWRTGETLDQLVARADAALYDAKRAGRDCVRAAPSTLEE
jgi:PleD family two-component response regulator